MIAPSTWEAWIVERAAIRATLENLLGELPPSIVPEVETLSVEERAGFRLEEFCFHNGDPIGGPGAVVTGSLLIPHRLTAPAPAIQYYHWHGGEYSLGRAQLWRTNERGRVIAEELTSRGYIVQAIDAYGFGERSGTGPDGPTQKGSAEEMSWSKLNLWYGRTLWGMMLRDESLALDYLLTRPEVDAGRIGAMGISMGSTRTWWRMALDERIRVGIGVACLTRYQDLIAHRALAAHGIYYFVPGMLRHFDSEAVVALCAPRPLLCLNGDSDEGTPVSGIEAINAFVGSIYALCNASEHFVSRVYPQTGHEWTSAMWEATFDWLARPQALGICPERQMTNSL
jgi:dienelactone hydrolase